MIIIRLFLSVKVNDGCSLSVKFNKLRKGGCRLRSINKISVGQVQYGYIRSRSIVRIRANEISAVKAQEGSLVIGGLPYHSGFDPPPFSKLH